MNIKQILDYQPFKDVRYSLLKHRNKKYEKRTIEQIKTIAIHHSGTTVGDAKSFARYHVKNKQWPGIGYHFVIERDGTIKWTNSLETISYHVGNSNKRAVGICMTGNFKVQKPTKEQWNALYILINTLMNHLPNVKSVSSIRGHQEYPGYSWKTCPSLDMDRLRGNIETNTYEPVENDYYNDQKILIKRPSGFSKPNPEWYIIQKGDTLWDIANNHDNLSVEDILSLNPGLHPEKLKVGQRIRLRKETREVKKPIIFKQKILEYGDRGEAVKILQEALKRLGIDPGPIDGIFGKKTKDALLEFQHEFPQLKDDGIFGRATRIIMEKCLRYEKTWR